jgi:hypothetical protein
VKKQLTERGFNVSLAVDETEEFVAAFVNCSSVFRDADRAKIAAAANRHWRKKHRPSPRLDIDAATPARQGTVGMLAISCVTLKIGEHTSATEHGKSSQKHQQQGHQSPGTQSSNSKLCCQVGLHLRTHGWPGEF